LPRDTRRSGHPVVRSGSRGRSRRFGPFRARWRHLTSSTAATPEGAAKTESLGASGVEGQKLGYAVQLSLCAGHPSDALLQNGQYNAVGQHRGLEESGIRNSDARMGRKTRRQQGRQPLRFLADSISGVASSQAAYEPVPWQFRGGGERAAKIRIVWRVRKQ
jgi:hypothetical protein